MKRVVFYCTALLTCDVLFASSRPLGTVDGSASQEVGMGYWVLSLCLLLFAIAAVVVYVRSRSMEKENAELHRKLDELNGEVAEQAEHIRRLDEQMHSSRKMESIGQLMMGIAHEINTPLQYISDNVHFLKMACADLHRAATMHEQLTELKYQGEVDPKKINALESELEGIDLEYLNGQIPRALSQSLEGLGRVIKIIRAIRDFSYPSQCDKKKADLNAGIEATITVARNEWKYVAEMNTDYDPRLPQVQCLLDEFNQVILNMVVNAAHAIADLDNESKGLDKETISVSTRRDGDWVEVRISDTGVGIPEEIRDKIFNRFFTTKEVGRGTGQGLYLAHDVIVNKHQGIITCESQVGKGTTFIIRLPIMSPTIANENGEPATKMANNSG